MGAKASFKLKGGRPSAAASVAVKSIDENRCSICQESVGVDGPDGAVETWSRLPCGHRFGSLCVKRWLGLSAQPSCPMCRSSMAHLCGHPLVPEPDARHHGLARRLRRPALGAPCRFCKHAMWRALPRPHHVLRFIGGVVYIALPRRRQGAADRRHWETFRQVHRTEFGEWWAAQQPPTEPAAPPPILVWT